MGTSEEMGATQFSTPDGMFNSGYYLGKNDKVVMTGEVVNYTNDTKKIYSVSDIEYISGRPTGSMDVSITILSVNQCDGGNPMLKPPEGKNVFSFQSKNMTITQNGYILTRSMLNLQLLNDKERLSDQT
jgi:hypothetical protein